MSFRLERALNTPTVRWPEDPPPQVTITAAGAYRKDEWINQETGEVRPPCWVVHIVADNRWPYRLRIPHLPCSPLEVTLLRGRTLDTKNMRKALSEALRACRGDVQDTAGIRKEGTRDLEPQTVYQMS